MVIHSCKMCEYGNECALKPQSNVVKNCCLFVKKSPQTNADRIRSMSDKEMARDLIDIIMEVCEDGVPTEDYFLQWLKSKAKE